MLLAVLIVSCFEQRTKDIYERQLPLVFNDNLLRIDSLIQYDADSALQTLLSFRADSVVSTEAQRSGEISCHYHSLLLSEALYKTYNVQYYRNDLINATHYFDSLLVRYPGNDDITMLSARSHYMNGVGYYENDSIVDACKEYLHTLEIMENHFDEKELVGYKAKFMALTYNRLVEMFSSLNMMTPTIECCKRALYYVKIEPTSKYGSSKSLLLIGKQYHMMREYDSASYYYNLALSELPDSNNQTYRNIIASISLLNYELGYDAKISIDSLKQLVQLTSDKSEVLSLSLDIGYLYYIEKQYDSALFYLENVYNYHENIASKIQSAEFLKTINQIRDNKENINRYNQFLSEHTIINYEKATVVSELDNIFNKYNLYQKDKVTFLEKNRAIKIIIAIIIPITSLIVIIVFMITRKWGKRNIEFHKQALKKKEESISDIKMKIKIKQFIKEPICDNILKIVKEQNFKSKIEYINYKEYALGKEQILELRETANLHYDNFTLRLKEQFSDLTDDDINYCCLYLLGLKDADIAALMQKEYSNICRRNRKIRSILGSNKNLTETLYNLASI